MTSRSTEEARRARDGASFLAAGLSPGVNSVAVRTVDSAHDTSVWATATVTVVVVAPGQPVLSVPATVNVPTVAVSWAPCADALSYEYRLDDGVSTPTVATSVSLPLDVGPHEVAVRALNSLSQSDWTTAAVTYELPSTPALTLSSSSARVAYPTTVVTLTGFISAPSEPVQLQSSTDGITWIDTGQGWTSAASPVPVSRQVALTRSMLYRLTFAGDGPWTSATSTVVAVAYVPHVYTPSMPSRVKRKVRFTVSDSVRAPAANGLATVTFQFSRYQKVRGHYKWVLRKSVRVRGSVSSSTLMTFKAKTSVSYTGRWHVVAVYSGAPLYANATTSARAFSVR